MLPGSFWLLLTQTDSVFSAQIFILLGLMNDITDHKLNIFFSNIQCTFGRWM